MDLGFAAIATDLFDHREEIERLGTTVILVDGLLEMGPRRIEVPAHDELPGRANEMLVPPAVTVPISAHDETLR